MTAITSSRVYVGRSPKLNDPQGASSARDASYIYPRRRNPFIIKIDENGPHCSGHVTGMGFIEAYCTSCPRNEPILEVKNLRRV
ncbi:hypothetical protein CMI45_01965 [Candidatus Pacearchaeota archaeon]|nr:hypothetical protein [Candidatus Pacearchaeota archaeon]|tara:strand:+ start:1847 stop:2098 length:252 start_codon:yes stop_codon:yes gene_type:complete